MAINEIIFICGSPAVGKSTYARKLALEKGACLLDSDTVSETLIQTSLLAMGNNPDDRDSEFYKSTFRIPVYETLYKIADENLAFVPVIVVAPFTKEIQNPNWLEELKERFKVPVSIIYLHCSEAIKYERMKQRAEKRDQPKLKDWATYLKYFGEETPPACPHTAIDTSNLNK